MPQAGTKSRVIWHHPRGSFDVIEHCGTSVLGTPYRIREAVLTPEWDERGIAHKEEPPKPDRSTWKSTARKHSYRRIGPKEAAMIADMYQAGYRKFTQDVLGTVRGGFAAPQPAPPANREQRRAAAREQRREQARQRAAEKAKPVTDES